MPIKYLWPQVSGGANDGSTPANAWQSTQAALNNFILGDTILCRGYDNIITPLLPDQVSGPVAFKAVNDSWQEKADARYLINGNGALSYLMYGSDNINTNYYHIKGWEFTGATGYAVYMYPPTKLCYGWLWENVYIHDCGGGIYSWVRGQNHTYLNCKINNVGAGTGIYAYYGKVIGCEIIIAGTGIYHAGIYGSIIAKNIVHDCSTYGIRAGVSRAGIIENIIDECDIGLFAEAAYLVVYGNRLTNNINKAILNGGAFVIHAAVNAFFNPGAVKIDLAGGNYINAYGDKDMVSDGYRDRANHNFELLPKAENRREKILIGGYNE